MQEGMQKTEVLVCGAGPTGLVLAVCLARFGVRTRVVDKAPEPGLTSRAVGVQARTLELYRQLGFAQEVVEHGLRFRAANFWVRGERQVHFQFGDGDMGQGVSPYPYMLIYPQDEHERLLGEKLAALGVRVERSTEVTSLRDEGNRVLAELRHADGRTEALEADYVAGCDGARSFVRQTNDVGFPGGTYEGLFYVADVEATGPQMNRELHLALDDGDFLACFPLAGEGRARLIGAMRAGGDTRELQWSSVDPRVLRNLHLEVTKVNWFSTYRVHHRVARAFRIRRSFLLGDAAHVHSPVGGQGMNTGIGDAVNLAWKLAAAVHGADDSLLDTYADERVPFAERLVKTTDRVFELVNASGVLAERLRLGVVPSVLGTLTKSSHVRRFMFDTISQTLIRYRRSPLSEGRVGPIHGGDRLPWAPFEGPAPDADRGKGGPDNFEPLRSLAWQVHAYGEAGPELRAVCERGHLALHALPWNEHVRKAGIERDSVFVVRPDGYVGLATPGRDAAPRVEAYTAKQAKAIAPLTAPAGKGMVTR